MNATLAGLAAALLYTIASVILGRQLARRETPRHHVIVAIGGLALPLHLLAAHAQIYQPDGLNLGLLPVVSLIGWLITTLTIGLSLYKPIISITIVSFPLATLSILLSLAFPTSAPLTATLSPGAESHILLSILAYSVLAIAAAQATLITIQDHQLKRHKRGLLHALPPLQTMESLLFSLIWTGFALLSLAILSGFLTLNDLFAQHLAHKTLLTLAAWAVFATLLTGRYTLGWRGTTATRFTLWGFGLLLVGFYGSKLVLEMILQRGA
jgi:ABC-type uncharacterized transport system permease subunit